MFDYVLYLFFLINGAMCLHLCAMDQTTPSLEELKLEVERRTTRAHKVDTFDLYQLSEKIKKHYPLEKKLLAHIDNTLKEYYAIRNAPYQPPVKITSETNNIRSIQPVVNQKTLSFFEERDILPFACEPKLSDAQIKVLFSINTIRHTSHRATYKRITNLYHEANQHFSLEQWPQLQKKIRESLLGAKIDYSLCMLMYNKDDKEILNWLTFICTEYTNNDCVEQLLTYLKKKILYDPMILENLNCSEQGKKIILLLSSTHILKLPLLINNSDIEKCLLLLMYSKKLP